MLDDLRESSSASPEELRTKEPDISIKLGSKEVTPDASISRLEKPLAEHGWIASWIGSRLPTVTWRGRYSTCVDEVVYRSRAWILECLVSVSEPLSTLLVLYMRRNRQCPYNSNYQ